jgi:CRP/FNR family cyclic AMP-dependent transcriptional regulator
MLADDAQNQALLQLFHTGTRLAYKKGELIVRPNETPSGVFFIEEGIVKAYDITKYGEENLLIIRKENEIFPLIRTLSGNAQSIIYEAITPVTVWRVDQAKYLKALQTDVAIMLPILDLVVEMYRIHSERIINLEYRSVRERLISFLLSMAGRFGRKTADGTLIDIPLKHQDIASSINSSRETTSRELSGLERKGLISSKQSRITIKNKRALKAFL